MATTSRELLAAPGTGELVEALTRSRGLFTPEARATRRRALEMLAGRAIDEAQTLLAYHEALLFLRAYPDDARALAAVDGELARFAGRVGALPPRQAAALEGTGIAGTEIRCPFSLPAARWIASAFPGHVEIAWDRAEEIARLGPALGHVIPLLDEDALVEAGVSWRTWVAGAGADGAAAGGAVSALAWLLARLDAAGVRGLARRALEALEIPLVWSLADTAASRTRARLAPRAPSAQRTALHRPHGPLRRHLPGPPMPVTRVSRAAGTRYLDVGRAAVSVRFREIHAFNHADPADVLVARDGRGLEIAWAGLAPAHRLPLRAHYGYVLLRNGVPVGYGDASLLFDWVELAFNVFDTFRHGESALALLRIVAFLHRRFGTRAVLLAPYQIGQGNLEALESGAFWFYDRLGFRPVRADLARLADAERQRIAREPGYRSPRRVLERLSGGSLHAALAGVEPAVAAFDARALARRALGGASRVEGVTRLLAGRSGRRRETWTPSERAALGRIAPILALVPGLDTWPRRDLEVLAAAIRAKGSGREEDYLRGLRRLPRLRRALLALGTEPSRAPVGPGRLSAPAARGAP